MIKYISVILVIFVSLLNAADSVKGELLIQMTQTKQITGTLAKTLPSEIDGVLSKYSGKSETILKSDLPTDTLQIGTLGKVIAQEKVIIKVTDVENDDLEKITEELKQIDGVQYVEPNYIFQTDDFNNSTTNPKETDQWYLNENNVKDAWNLFTQDDIGKLQNVVVAVLDSGVDYAHEDLKDAMWINSGEIPNDGIDNDSNGYIDDVYGANVLYKTLNNTPNATETDPKDNHGHGTHVAGIIGAVNNDKGIIGIASGVKIMAIKCVRADGSLTTEDIVKALEYARDMGADVANMSFGGGSDSSILKDALADLSATATLIASAGNSAKPVEWDLSNSCGMKGIKPAPNFPAAYPFVLGVEASSQTGALAGFSNCDPVAYSQLEYEVRLPGVAIMSTLPGDAYAAWNGTSMAAPVASALAALIKAKQWDNQDIFTNRMMQAQVAKYSSNFSDALTQLPTPDLKYFTYSIFDSNTTSPNDGDGLADAGETVKLALQLKNYWGAAKDITLKVSPGFIINGTSTFSADDYVTIKDSNGDNGSKTINLAQIGSYTVGDNGIVTDEYGNITDVTIPIELVVDPAAPNLHRAVFTVEAEYKNAIDDNDTATYFLAPNQFSFDLQNGIEKRGVITSDETWPTHSRIIVTGPLAVADGITLTIEEGTEIRFTKDTYIKTLGTLIVNGTKENKVLFTYNKGDAIYNDTWNGLVFERQGSIINYAIIEDVHYSENNLHSSASIIQGSVNVDNSIIRESLCLPTNGTYTNCIFDLTSHGGNWYTDLYGYNSPEFINSIFRNFHDKQNLNFVQSRLTNTVFDLPSLDKSRTLTISSNDTSNIDSLASNIYISGRKDLFSYVLEDYSDTFDSGDIRLSDSGDNDEMLSRTMLSAPSTTPAFLVSAQWLDDTNSSKTILDVGSTYKLRLTFNKEKMQTEVQPLVTFGSLEPYTDKTITGDWIDEDANGLAKIWEGDFTVDRHSGTGENTIRVSSAFDDDMYYDAPISEVYKFTIISSGAQAMVLQAVGGNGQADISWMQDDYEMVGGYNIYRANTQDGTYEKINNYPVLGLTYTDIDVQAGETYYYTFKAILSDGSLSSDSNIASATILDNVKPTITHTPILKVHPGNSQRITTVVTDNIEVSNVKLYYSVVGGGSFIEADMVATSVSNQYAYTIATSYFNEGVNLEYKIEATDNSGNTQETLVNTILVTTGDVAPIIDQISNKEVLKNSSSFTVPLNIVDADGEAMSITATSSDDTIATVSLNYNKDQLTVAPQTDKYGTVTISVTASNALTATMSFDVTITHDDQFPIINEISNISKLKDFDTFIVPVIASDPDGDQVQLSIENSNNNIITATLNGTDIEISSVAYAVGQSTIKVTATANGKSVSREFLVEVMLSDNGQGSTYNYQLNEGWNLIGFLPQSAISAIESELQDSTNVRIIWKYDNVSKAWQGYSPIASYAEQLTGMQIANINSTDGVWVNCKQSMVITLDNPPSPGMTAQDIVLNDTWNLVSSPDGSSIDPSTFTNAQIVWKYYANKWSAYSSDVATAQEINDLNIDTFTSISGSEGFWVLK